MSTRMKGLWMVVIAATMWGLSGTVAQWVFQQKHILTEWLVFVRMIVSGFCLLAVATLRRIPLFHIWRERSSRLLLIFFSLVGMLGVQYTYFLSIAHGNAAAATLLQYLAPIYIVLYFFIRERKQPSISIWGALILAICGTFLLLTNGKMGAISISFSALFWGVISGLLLAFYTICSAKLLKKWDSLIIVGWAMVLGGIAMAPSVSTFFQPFVTFDIRTIISILFIVVCGTLLAFLLFIESIRHLSPTESSILSSVEPLSAIIASVLFLHVSFGFFQTIGSLLIIATVVLLGRQKMASPS
ncbi:DMT family transporter [Anoxybacillus kestanbolensis]|uniref:DMT family transporter n=1 Tax=Anoxybacillus kestanbolensis TaxID=227476 RepID=UPI003D19B4D4